MSEIPAEIIKKRQDKLSNALKNAKMKGIVLNPGPSLTYMTGLHFHLSERPVVLLFQAEGPPALVLPELEAGQVKDLPYELGVFTYGEDPDKWSGQFVKAAQSLGLDGEEIGVEDRVLRLLELKFLQTAMPEAQFLNAIDVMANLRMYKDESETAAMQAAVDIAEKALDETLPMIKIGMTEKELASELTLRLMRGGSGEFPFLPIIASGPNSANPHAFPTDKKLVSGDLLVIDWGASVDGYFSDITRTFGVGELNEEQIKIHQIVVEANAAARAIAKPGIFCGDVDKAARDFIDESGYGEWFIHRTGHGLGVEVHEEPYMRADNPMKLEPGMTFTIEPGIYRPDLGGVRIEDDVVVTKDGLKSLSTMKRDLQIVG